jgi:hypothetical protein
MSELLARIDDWSDRLSPIVVKEIRQMVRGREFNYALGISLLAGLIVAFFGLADALVSAGTSGSSVFTALMGCLALVGLIVVPLGTFNALRSERVEQTLDLITQTTLTARRIVTGKLMTQAVKLIVLFSGLAPFIAMSFLLGGIDMRTILVSLAGLFVFSLWVCSVCLFMSAASNSRAMSVVLFVGLAIGAIYLVGIGSTMIFSLLGLIPVPAPTLPGMSWFLAATVLFCLVSMGNFLLLAENRLASALEDRSTALRIGFLVQFLLILVYALAPALTSPAPAVTGTFVGGYTTFVGGYTTAASATDNLAFWGGLHLALTAVFAVTEDLVLSRRVFQRIRKSLRRPWAIFRPGGGRGVLWILAQMSLLLIAGLVVFSASTFSALVAICAYICFFTGVPTVLMRHIFKERAKTAYLRAGILLFFPIVAISADLLLYLLTPGMIFDGSFSGYHILNPFRALANWNFVQSQNWVWRPMVMGLIGLMAYLEIFRMGRREDRNAAARYN